MNLPFRFSEQLSCLYQALHFFKKHLLALTGLGLVAAFGRVIQLGGFGAIPSWADVVLEVVVEAARVALFLFVLGIANIKTGVSRIKKFSTQKQTRALQWTAAVQNVKNRWRPALLNVAGFSAIAWGLNYLIDLLAYETCLYLTLKKDGILAAAASEWTILLFFKNLSVIPFTLVFETLLLLWLTNNLRPYRPVPSN